MNNHSSSGNRNNNPRGRASFEPRYTSYPNRSAQDIQWADQHAPNETSGQEFRRAEGSQRAERATLDEFAYVGGSSVQQGAAVPQQNPDNTNWSARAQVIKGNSTVMPQGGSLWPLFFWAVIVVVVAFVLPDLPLFSNAIDTEGWTTSGMVDSITPVSESDIQPETEQNAAPETEPTGTLYLYFNDENTAVTELQKALYKLERLDFSDISGNYDNATHLAVNNLLAAYGISESGGCSLGSYELIIRLASEAPSTTTTTATTTEPVEMTTTTTEPTGTKKIRITANPMTKLRQEPKTNSIALYNLDKGTKYEVIEELIDAEGEVWYRIRYYYNNYEPNWIAGWVCGKYAEVFYE